MEETTGVPWAFVLIHSVNIVISNKLIFTFKIVINFVINK